MPSVPKTILVVDDEPETTDMIAEMMRLSGYQVIKAYGGLQTLKLIVNQKPDAVVLDWMMPDLSGLDVLKSMRKDPRLADIPVILVSAKTMPEDIDAGLNAGASYYLTKPVTYKDLKQTVGNTIRSH